MTYLVVHDVARVPLAGTGYCRSCWALVAVVWVAAPLSVGPRETPGMLATAKDHARPIVPPNATCLGSGQALERVA